jgi:hypothetical protein
MFSGRFNLIGGGWVEAAGNDQERSPVSLSGGLPIWASEGKIQLIRQTHGAAGENPAGEKAAGRSDNP